MQKFGVAKWVFLSLNLCSNVGCEMSIPISKIYAAMWCCEMSIHDWMCAMYDTFSKEKLY